MLQPPPLPSPSQPRLLAGICWCPPFILSLGQEGDEHGHLLVLRDAQPACAVRPQNTKGVSLGHAGLAAAGVGGRVPAGGCLCSQGCWGAGGHALSLRRWQETLRDFSTPPLVPACRVSIFPARGRWQDQGRASAGSAPPLLLQPSPAARIRAQPGLTPPPPPLSKNTFPFPRPVSSSVQSIPSIPAPSVASIPRYQPLCPIFPRAVPVYFP